MRWVPGVTVSDDAARSWRVPGGAVRFYRHKRIFFELKWWSVGGRAFPYCAEIRCGGWVLAGDKGIRIHSAMHEQWAMEDDENGDGDEGQDAEAGYTEPGYDVHELDSGPDE